MQQQVPDSVGRTVAIRTLDYKLVYRPAGVNELYEMITDPQELDTRYEDAALADIRRKLERDPRMDTDTSDATPFAEDAWWTAGAR